MKITPISKILPPDLAPPTLKALVPDSSNYKALLLQPRGEIQINADGVHNRDQAKSKQQFSQFVNDALDTKADIAITPEYSMPWDVLTEAITSGKHPVEGQLWIFGCESITYSELEVLKQKMARYALFLFEPLKVDPKRFLDPLAYIFLAPHAKSEGSFNLVVLVQFKTQPMGDKGHFEVNGLQKGSQVYQFGKTGESVRLVSLICSDVFALKDEDIKQIYNQSLIIHIQLNPRPRQEQYREYRDGLFGYSGDATELICLNWARNVREWSGARITEWKNNSSSAWYLKPDKFDNEDDTLCANQQRGLYYTWFESKKTHSLFFNFDPATFLFEATKVVHIAVHASLSRRRGPQLTRTCTWNCTKNTWDETKLVEGGFLEIASESDHAKDDLVTIVDRSPLEAERVLMLSAGNLEGSDWYKVHRLGSCRIDASEVICRITFCQDTHNTADAFRVKYLKRFGHLWNILKNEDPAPTALKDFSEGFSFGWSSGFPHQNVTSSKGNRATVIYMGEDSGETQINKTFIIAAENLRRAADDEAEGRFAMQRLVVWHRKNGTLQKYRPHAYVGISQRRGESPVDIGKTE